MNTKSLKWTVNAFSYILDTDRGLNSFTYGWELVKSLCNPQMEKRRSIINLPKSSVAKINIMLGNPLPVPVVVVSDELYSYKAEKNEDAHNVYS